MIEFNEPAFDCFTILPALTMKRFILILPLAVTQIGVVLGAVAINEEDVYCYT